MRGPNPKRRTGKKSDSTTEKKDNSEITSISSPNHSVLYLHPLDVGMIKSRFEHLLFSEEIATGENAVPLFM